MTNDSKKKLTPTKIQQLALETLINEYMALGTEGWFKFMRDELKYTPDACIEPVIADVSEYKDTTVRSCHGVGKTAMDAACLLTALALVPNLGCLQLAPTWRQVKDILWNEIRKWFRNSRILPVLFHIAEKAPRMESKWSPETWYARGVSTTHAANVEGEHNQRLFLIIDEAKAVEDQIIEGAQGMLTNVGADSLVWQLWTSTPSTPGGGFTMFYKSHTKLQSFAKHKITAKDSPRVSQRWVDQMVSFWGADSQIVQARVNGEFPMSGDDILITLQEAEQFYQEGVESEGSTTIGVDVARFGEDESVISVWQGMTLIEVHPFEKKNTTQVAGIVTQMAIDKGAGAIAIDDIGVGGGVTDQVEAALEKQVHCHVIPFTASARATDPMRYRVLKDEVWWQFAQALREKRAFSKVKDDLLEGQLTSYKIKYTADSRIHVVWPERNKDRASSNSKSPDRGDAVIIGWWAATLLYGALEMAKEEEEEVRVRERAPLSKGIRNRSF